MGALSTADVDGVGERSRCRFCGDWFTAPPDGIWQWVDRFYGSAIARCECCSRERPVDRWTESEWAALEQIAPEVIAEARPVPNRQVEREEKRSAESER